MLLAREYPIKTSVSSFNTVAFKAQTSSSSFCFYVPTQANPPVHACHLSLRLHVILFSISSMPSSHPVDIDMLYGKVY